MFVILLGYRKKNSFKMSGILNEFMGIRTSKLLLAENLEVYSMITSKFDIYITIHIYLIRFSGCCQGYSSKITRNK